MGARLNRIATPRFYNFMPKPTKVTYACNSCVISKPGDKYILTYKINKSLTKPQIITDIFCPSLTCHISSLYKCIDNYMSYYLKQVFAMGAFSEAVIATVPEHLRSPKFFLWRQYNSILSFVCSVLQVIVFLLTIVLYFLLSMTSGYSFGIFKLLFKMNLGTDHLT